MTKFALTGLVLLAALVFLLGWDLYVVLRDGSYTNTISNWFHWTTTTGGFQILGVFVGIVIGHFFWPIHDGSTE